MVITYRGVTHKAIKCQLTGGERAAVSYLPNSLAKSTTSRKYDDPIVEF